MVRSDDLSLIHVAAKYGNVNIIETLLRNGKPVVVLTVLHLCTLSNIYIHCALKVAHLYIPNHVYPKSAALSMYSIHEYVFAWSPKSLLLTVNQPIAERHNVI